MKKLNPPLYVILIFIIALGTASCGKSGDGGGGGGGGVIVLLGDLIGFWQTSSDSFTFGNEDGKLAGSGTIGGRSGDVTNSKIDKYQFSFDLVFSDDNSVKSYTGTIDQSKKIIKLTSGGTTTTFNKQE